MSRQSSPITTVPSRTPPTGKLGHPLDNRSSTSNLPRPHGGFHHHPSGLIPPDETQTSASEVPSSSYDWLRRPTARSLAQWIQPSIFHCHFSATSIPKTPKRRTMMGASFWVTGKCVLATRSVEGSNFTHVPVQTVATCVRRLAEWLNSVGLWLHQEDWKLEGRLMTNVQVWQLQGDAHHRKKLGAMSRRLWCSWKWNVKMIGEPFQFCVTGI